MGIQDNILDSIYNSIINISGLSGNVFIEQAPQGKSEPYIVCSISSDVPEHYFVYSGSDEDYTICDFQVAIFGRKVDGARQLRDIGDKIFYVFDGQDITTSGFSGAFTYCLSRGSLIGGNIKEQENLYAYLQLYTFKGNRIDNT